MAPVKPQKPKAKPSSSSASSKSAKPAKSSKPKARNATHNLSGTVKAKPVAAKKKKRVYTEKELGIPTLNMITPAGVQKPKGKKKGKVFVDDQRAHTIRTMVDGGGSPATSAEPLILVFVFSGFSPEFREFILCCFRLMMESMMTILAMVNAEKEGQIESKMMKARQMEEIREARRNEAEARQVQKRSDFEETKDSLRRKRKSKSDAPSEKKTRDDSTPTKTSKPSKPSKKRVSFG